MMDIKQIKPKGKDSDKYSIQLYNFMKKNYPNGCSVSYISTQTKWNKETQDTYEEDKPFDENTFFTGDIWIGKTDREDYDSEDFKGYINWMYGNSLGTILSGSRNKYTVFANPWNIKKTVIDITSWFWNKYIEIGRCIWDRDHDGWLAKDENRFTYIDDDNRKCNWCGEVQHKEIKEETVVNRKEIWITDTIK